MNAMEKRAWAAIVLVTGILGTAVAYDGYQTRAGIPDQALKYAGRCESGTITRCSQSQIVKLEALYQSEVLKPTEEFQVGEGLLIGAALIPLFAYVGRMKKDFDGLSTHKALIAGGVIGGGLCTFIFAGTLVMYSTWIGHGGSFNTNPLYPLLSMFLFAPQLTGGRSAIGLIGVSGLLAASMTITWLWGMKRGLSVMCGSALLYLLILALSDPGDLSFHMTNFTQLSFDGIWLLNNASALVALTVSLPALLLRR